LATAAGRDFTCTGCGITLQAGPSAACSMAVSDAAASEIYMLAGAAKTDAEIRANDVELPGKP
jgi:hypothetical protein